MKIKLKKFQNLSYPRYISQFNEIKESDFYSLIIPHHLKIY